LQLAVEVHVERQDCSHVSSDAWPVTMGGNSQVEEEKGEAPSDGWQV